MHSAIVTVVALAAIVLWLGLLLVTGFNPVTVSAGLGAGLAVMR